MKELPIAYPTLPYLSPLLASLLSLPDTQVKELFDAGLITEEEYEEKKAALVSKI